MIFLVFGIIFSYFWPFFGHFVLFFAIFLNSFTDFLYHLICLVKGFPKRYHTWWLRDFSGVLVYFLAIFGHLLAILFDFWPFFFMYFLIFLYYPIALVNGFSKSPLGGIKDTFWPSSQVQGPLLTSSKRENKVFSSHLVGVTHPNN